MPDQILCVHDYLLLAQNMQKKVCEQRGHSNFKPFPPPFPWVRAEGNCPRANDDTAGEELPVG